jgi:hypothetical protein
LKYLRKIASSNNSDNLSSKFRRKRFRILQKYLTKLGLKEPLFLDIGGTQIYWDHINSYFKANLSPIIVNIEKGYITNGIYAGIIGDGKSLSFIKDNTFDLAYSNSVIEHLTGIEDQYEMAYNIKRVSKYYFIQTPAFIFPLEPHFLFPFFHWLPKKVRIWFILKFNLGWYQKCQSFIEAKKLVDSIRILKKKELKLLFKDAHIITERLFLIPKSYTLTNMI